MHLHGYVVGLIVKLRVLDLIFSLVSEKSTIFLSASILFLIECVEYAAQVFSILSIFFWQDFN